LKHWIVEHWFAETPFVIIVVFLYWWS